MVSFHQNLLQKDGFKGFLPTLDKSEVNKLADIIAKQEYANPYGDYIKAFEIGEGKKEVIEAILVE